MATRRTCLRCGRRPATKSWQCAACAKEFADWMADDRSALLQQLEAHERALIAIADRLDGDGLWAIAKTVSRAADRVGDIGAAIERELGRSVSRSRSRPSRS